ncbi:MAG: ABC transporter permease subunit [Chthoniobacterales bacterium]
MGFPAEIAALPSTIALTAAAVALGLAAGWPVGVACGLFRFTGRRIALAILLLPLLLPSLVLAIGLSMLRVGFRLPDSAPFSGFAGCVWAHGALAMSLAAWGALLALRGISGSQVDAALIAGGDTTLWRAALRLTWPSALAGALLGGAIAAGESGPGVLLGWPTAAGEILAAFAARYDFAEAARRSLALGAVTLAAALILARPGAFALEAAVTSRDPSRTFRLRVSRFGRVAGLVACVIALLVCLLPLVGLLLPLLRTSNVGRAWAEVVRTAGPTLWYSLGAAFIACAAAWPLAIWAHRREHRERWLLVLMLALLAMPSVLLALGWIRLANCAPAALDPWVRGRAAVALILGVRLLPIAFVLALRRWTAMPLSWRDAAAMHGVPAITLLRRIVLPHQLPGIALALGLVAVLAATEVTIVLLLHPPGAASLPLAIFTIMANAPDALVASLCLSYVAPVLLIALGLPRAFSTVE